MEKNHFASKYGEGERGWSCRKVHVANLLGCHFGFEEGVK